LSELVDFASLELVLGAKLHRAQGVFRFIVGKGESRISRDRTKSIAVLSLVETCPERSIRAASFEERASVIYRHIYLLSA
jgi:hypothetical protein